jgi:hypothetical protein
VIAKGAGDTAATPFEFLYLNWTYMATLGNGYLPASSMAHLFQVAAATAGILLLGIVAARALGVIGDTSKVTTELGARIERKEGDEACIPPLPATEGGGITRSEAGGPEN